MKNLVLALLALTVGAESQARSIKLPTTIAELGGGAAYYPTPIPGAVRAPKRVLTQTQLTETGYLRIVVKDLDARTEARIGYVLSPNNAEGLTRQVRALSNSELEEHFAGAVCAMLPSPEAQAASLSVLRGWDWETESYTGDLEKILTPRGCWVSYRINPVDKHDHESALELRTVLQTLVREAVFQQSDEIERQMNGGF